MSDRKTLIEMLQRNRLFEGFTKADLEHVLNSSQEVQYPAEKEVVTEGRNGVGFHLILDGEAVVRSQGREIRRLGAGDSFGDIAVIDGGPRSATVVATQPLHTLALLPWEFKPLLLEHPEMAFKLLLKVTALLREAEHRPPV
jgi:CRP/FNR family transcriptional regulator, cyclic AMP receptor protein